MEFLTFILLLNIPGKFPTLLWLFQTSKFQLKATVYPLVFATNLQIHIVTCCIHLHIHHTSRTPYLFIISYPLRWRIYVFNSVVNTKLPAFTTVRLNRVSKARKCGLTCQINYQSNGIQQRDKRSLRDFYEPVQRFCGRNIITRNFIFFSKYHIKIYCRRGYFF